MDRFLFIIGIAVFAISLFILVMNFIGDYDEQALIVSVLGMLNASIAMGVSEILSKMKNIQKIDLRS
ncbi:MAG: hypothetical protein WBB47_07895 [Paenisporosarcina sp.]